MAAVETTARPCAIADALGLIGERWSLLVIREIFWRQHRFADIQRNTGAPRDVLSARLRTLLEAGLIEKRQYSERPPRSDYHLTAAGRDLAPVLTAIALWGKNHLPAEDDRPFVRHGDHEIDPVVETSCRVCGESIGRLSADGTS